MPIAHAGAVDLYYETFGDPADEPMLLIMGLGRQLTGWDEGFCKLLMRNGFFVIRYDNRDVGLSTKVEHDEAPNPIAVLTGDRTSVAYSLEELASDAVALLDALHIESAHLVGASMGGMVAQVAAIRHPHRVRSLVSIMATTGNPSVGYASSEAIAALFAAPIAESKEAIIDRLVSMQRTLGSPSYRLSDRQVRAFVEREYERSYSPEGARRQLVAILAAEDRTEDLARVHVPTLVIHGSDDPLVDLSGAEATAKAIPEAELMIIEGMGHDLPYAKWPEIIDAITQNARRAS